jgi:hypothetical protein
MQVLFVLAFFFVAAFSDEDCECASASADRENLFECVETFLPHTDRDAFYTDNKELITDRVSVRAAVRLLARQAARTAARTHARYLARYLARYAARTLARDAMARSKRDYQDEICSCLTATTACLEDSTCSSTALPLICNVASGRIFGGCTECLDQVNLRETYQTREQIIEKITALSDSLLQYILSRTTSISDIDLDITSGTLQLSVVVTNGEDHSIALNNIVYFLSKALDVLPGSISYEITNKRQETVTARLLVVDEEDLAFDAVDYSAGSSVTVGVMAVAALVLRFF